MTATDQQQLALEEEFVAFINLRRKKSGLPPNLKYSSDKLSRLRKVISIVGISELAKISDSNFHKIVESVMRAFPGDFPTSTGFRKRYQDYIVVIRQVYELKNKGKFAERYTYYAGKRRTDP